MKRPVSSLLVAGVVCVVASGCGSSKNYANNPRPPAPIVVAAAITSGGVTISPTHFGAGLVQIVITNLTHSSQQLTVQSASGGSFQQQTAPINPQDTAELKAKLNQGRYSVSVSSGALKGARLAVGPDRPSSQNDLLQP